MTLKIAFTGTGYILGVFARSLKMVQSTIYHAFESIFGKCTLIITEISLIYHHSVLQEFPVNP